MILIPLSLISLLFISDSKALLVSTYQEDSCRGAYDGGIAIGEGCKTIGAGVAQSAIISNTGPQDDMQYAVFFSSDDCNPSTQIAHNDDGCTNVYYKSWAIWNVCHGEKNLNCIT
jgi:hypothetical protein